VPRHFSSKDFEILDLDPPNNPTSQYGACHFGYILALVMNIKGKVHYLINIYTEIRNVTLNLTSLFFLY